VLPLVGTAQRTSVALTEAYLANRLRRQPLGLSPERLIGTRARRGTAPEEVYRRPFVTLWGGLGAGKGFEEASGEALARIASTIGMDVQLAFRETAAAVQEADEGIYGYQRVADGGASCAFCSEIDGAYVKSAEVFPLHNNCGCGLEPLTEPHPRAAWLPSGAAVRENFAIHEHGELGAVLTDPAHEFTTEAML